MSEDWSDDDEEDGDEHLPLGGPEEGEAASVEAAVEVTAGTISTGSLEVAQNIFKYVYNGPSAAPVRLSRQHFRAWTRADLSRGAAELVRDPRAVEGIVAALSARRVLVVHGEAEVGKATAVLLAAGDLCASLAVQGVLWCQSPAADVVVDLEGMARAGELQGQMLLFEDATAAGNGDLQKFLKNLDAVRLGALEDRLRRNGSFLVLTVRDDALAPLQSRLAGLQVLFRMDPPQPEVLLAALVLLSRRLPWSGEDGQRLDDFLAHQAPLVLGELGSVPRVASFVRECLRDVVLGRMSLRQAGDRMDNLSQWLLSDLAEDPAVRSMVLAVVLTSAVSPANHAPWFQFDRLRRAVFTALLPPAQRDDVPAAPMAERSHLDRARLEVVALPGVFSDAVRFRDDRYPARLWRVLLGDGRGLATLLVPHLRELAGDDDPFLRASAARALGRIGQIGPEEVVSPLVERWARLGEAAPDDLLGSLLQGGLASEDPAYRSVCLAGIRRWALHRETRAAAAAIFSLRMLGRSDPQVALGELRRIALSRLSVRMDALRGVDREMVAREAEIRREPTLRMRVFRAEAHVRLASALVPPPELPILGALQRSLAGVLFAQGGDPSEILSELNAWHVEEPARLLPLLVFLFLHRKGLFDLLDRHRWIPAFTTEPCSRYLLAAWQGESEARELAKLLQALLEGLELFPGRFRSLLLGRLLQVLKRWVGEACEVLEFRPVVIVLLARLLEAEEGQGRRSILDFLRQEKDFRVEGSRRRALVVEVLTGGPRVEGPATFDERPRGGPKWLTKR